MELSSEEGDDDDDDDDLELVEQSPIKKPTKTRTNLQDVRVLAALDACVENSKRAYQKKEKRKRRHQPIIAGAS